MNKFKKIGLKFFVSSLILFTVGGSLFYPRPAEAIFGIGDGVVILEDFSRRVSEVKSTIKSGINAAVVGMAVNTFSYFLRRVSYDTAVWLSSGGKGQSPFAHYKDFGSYMEDVGDNAAGVAIDALGSPYGLNLCKIPDPKIDLAMRIGLTKNLLDLNVGLNTQTTGEGVRQPNCTWTQFSNNVVDAAKSQFGQATDVAKKFNESFSLDQTDIGILMSATTKINLIVDKELEAQKLQRQEGEGIKPKTSLISGDISIPAKIVGKTYEDQSPSEQRKSAEAAFLATLGTGAINTIAGAGSLFLNTLASQMMKNFQTKGMLPFGVCVGGQGDASCKGLQDTLTSLEGQVSRGGRLAAQALFSDLLTPPSIPTDDYNVLSNFTNCPANPGPDNCVADAGLAQAAQESNGDKSITVADALAKNWLHGEWKLISPDRSADNTDPTCHQRAYCYANIAKLRKARVLPLGFEIAALNSNPDKPWTLKQIVDGFNDCNFIYNNGKVVGVDNDPVNKPFCHLIDPNWVIKAPPSKCNFMAYGASPYVAGTPNRAQECVDMTTCVAYDKDGNCATQGYCTREKNVWKIDAAKCDAENRTCRTFQDSTGKNVSYLYRTLDTGYCTQATVGCSQYSLKQNNQGNWTGYSRSDLDFGENSLIHFNNKLSTNCSANSDGCSAFQTVENSNQLYLKKAPYYLGCYDIDKNTPVTDWPQSVSDLNRLTPTTTCNNYAQPCIADEVSCNWYSPISYTGDNIPGKFTPAKVLEDGIVWNDQCDEKCVGYAAYREMPSNYSNGQSVDYIIPSSGARCNAVDEGCSSFTNLATTEGGLEKVEYFSYLRPCILPDTTKQKTFYTYEGSEVGGFQLKSFVLEKDTDGSPKYFYRTDDDKNAYNAICSESLYKQGLASPDCRQFNDDKGAVYYKLLSKTVAVTQSCTPYRLNETELYSVNLDQAKCVEQKGKWDGASCQVCFQNGEYRDGQCFYYGLPGSTPNTAGMSKTCSATANTCRAYKGNAGNNVRNIFSDNFEGTNILADWAPVADISQSLESTHNGEHSLSYNGNDGVYKNINITPGESYDIIFWAKGLAGVEDVTVTLESGVVGGINSATVDNLGTVSVGDVWQSYHLGPVMFSGSVNSAKLKFSLNGKIFLDNIHLKEVTDYLYLVKNTLKVDPICDSNLNDNLPGEALGCSQYKNSDNQSLYLTKFTSLCREKAIGCTALYDTRNTLEETGSLAYNVWLNGASGQKITKIIGGREYSCQIDVGQNGCYINTTGATLATIIADGGVIVTSTVYIPPDTASSTPVYLVANKEASCNAVDLGCTKAGKITQTLSGPTYSTVIIKQDPATYSNTLCQSEAVGCNAYASADGALYFKDPATIGQKVCAYRDNISKDGVSYKGWFWKGVGKCGGTGSLCTSDTECGAGVTCSKKDEQPCYPDYLQSGNNYGLWSYGVTNTYKNFVGECPSVQSGCTEFVDHNENNKPYYIISDERLKTNQTECNGEISEKAGCILMDRTDQPNKLWNTADSYVASANANNNLVKPSAGANNDANVILKVNRDRECGEWLQCRSSHRVFDQQLGTYKEVCDDIGRCNKAGDGAEGGIINCANWIDGTSEVSNNPLTESIYRDRSIDWKGQDFSGLSLLNVFPIEELSEINVGTALSADWRLAKPLVCGGVIGQNCKPNTGVNSTACVTSGQACGPAGVGMCLGNTCVKNFADSTNNANTQSIQSSCRAYPEETSPFPNTEAVGKSLSYNSVNLCNETGGRLTNDSSKAYACDCNYTKVNYGDSLTKYWNFNSPNQDGIQNKNGTLIKNVVSGICTGGANDGKVCATDTDCVNGSCQKTKSESRLIGWQGYCVEPDLSRPLNAEQSKFACLTWFPKDNISGSFDINNQHVEAGFQASTAGGKYYCLGAKGNQQNVNGSISYDKLLVNQNVVHCGRLAQGETIENCRENYNDSLAGGLGADREMRVVQIPDANSFYKDEIDYIKIIAHGNGDWFPNGTATFFIRNGLVTKYNGPQWSIVGKETLPVQKLGSGTTQETTNIPLGRYVSSDGTGSDAWYIRYDDGQGQGGDVNDAQFGDSSGNDVYSELGFRDLLVGEGVGNPTHNTPSSCKRVTVSGSDNFQDCTEDHDDEDDGCAIRVNFVGKKLDSINFVCHTGDHVDRESVLFDTYVGLRESCTYIAQTEKDLYSSVGWTNVLWEKNPQLGYGLYDRTVANRPFASLGLLNNLSPTEPLVNIFTHYNNTTFDIPPAVVGSPYSCKDDCLQTVPEVKEDFRSNSVSDKTLANAKDILSVIFAKISSVWEWRGSGYQENNPQGDLDAVPYNKTESLSDLAKAPKVHPLSTCKSGDKCLESTTPGMTVNGKSSGSLVFSSDIAKVNLKFYGYANKEQMPIRSIKLDWGDSTIVNLDGYFRNQRGAVNGDCRSAGNNLPSTCHIDPDNGNNPFFNTKKSCVSDSDCAFMDNCFSEESAQNFGQIANKTCDNTYFKFDHVYQCVRGDVPGGWKEGSLCSNGEMRTLYGGCCEFTPAVQLKDNWGWCNGSCPGGADGNGCYDSSWKPVAQSPRNECSQNDTAYTTSSVKIIVAPQ